jgi:hypothetical protein
MLQAFSLLDQEEGQPQGVARGGCVCPLWHQDEDWTKGDVNCGYSWRRASMGERAAARMAG